MNVAGGVHANGEEVSAMNQAQVFEAKGRGRRAENETAAEGSCRFRQPLEARELTPVPGER